MNEFITLKTPDFEDEEDWVRGKSGGEGGGERGLGESTHLETEELGLREVVTEV